MRAVPPKLRRANPLAVTPKTMLKRHLLTLLPSALATQVAVTLAAVTLAATAPAQTFRVNSTADSSDSRQGNGFARDSRGRTTLRAAIEEANTLRRVQTIEIPAGTYTLRNGPLRISQGVILRGLGAPGDVVIDGNNRTTILVTRSLDWAVCDYTGHTVKAFNSHGSFKRTLVAPRYGGLLYPRRASAGPGDLFVTGLLSGVHRYHGLTGRFTRTVVPASVFPFDHALSPSRTSPKLFVADYNNNRIRHFHPASGMPRGDIGRPYANGMRSPRALLTSGNRVYVASGESNRILCYHDDGRFDRVFATSYVDNPTAMVFGGPDYDLYVTESAADCVNRYDGRTGAFKGRFVTRGSGGLNAPTGIAFGSDDHLYVVSYQTRQVLRYDGKTGRFIDVYIAAGTSGLRRPISLNLIPGRWPGQLTKINNVTFRNGNVPTTTGGGGGIYNGKQHRLQLEGCRVEDCGSIGPGSGIYNLGRLTLTETAIVDNRNRSASTGGGVTATGGGIYNEAPGIVVARRCLIARNSAVRGGGINNNGGLISLLNTTISGNLAKSEAGGIRNTNNFDGDRGRMLISFCTITRNECNRFPRGAGYNHGAGIWNRGTIQIGDTIIAGNDDHRSRFEYDYAPDIYGPTGQILSHWDNIIGVGNLFAPIRDFRGGYPIYNRIGTETNRIDPRLRQLEDNGGPTMTHGLLPASPALNGDRHFNGGAYWIQPTKDQRGFTRPHFTRYRGDIGAFESGATRPRD